jgi:hypothetical protein
MNAQAIAPNHPFRAIAYHKYQDAIALAKRGVSPALLLSADRTFCFGSCDFRSDCVSIHHQKITSDFFA